MQDPKYPCAGEVSLQQKDVFWFYWNTDHGKFLLIRHG